VAVLPQNGVLAATRSWVLAVPVGDRGALSAWIAENHPDAVEEGAVRRLPAEGGDVFLRATGDHATFGYTRVFVERFDPAAALAPGDLPPGPIAVEIQLEPLVPLVQVGLAQGRAMLEQGAADAGDDAAANVGPTLDLYIGLVEDLLRNVSRLQISAAVEGGNFKLVKRLVPRAESTLGGLLAAQRGGLPELARHVDGQGAALVSVGQVEMTPAFRAALADYLKRHGAAMESLTAATPGLQGWMGEIAAPTADSIDCYRGDWAQVLRVDSASMRSITVGGVVDAERCRAALAGIAQSIGEFEPEAFVHGGVRASRQDTALPEGLLQGEESAAVEQLMAHGAGTTYTGFLGSLMLSTSGTEAEQGFRALVDRASGKSKGAGLEPALFAPLAPGPGMLARADLGALANLTEGDETAPPLSGTVLAGVRLAPEAPTIELLLPLSVLAAASAEGDEAQGP
jgi:hypothetical protein